MAITNLPQHVAIIMDGNGRWAKKRLMPRFMGHRAGVEVARQIVKHCIQRQIKVLSLFAFSNENWRRPAQESGFLMDLFLTTMEQEVQVLHDHQVQLRFIGERANFSDKLRTKIAEVEALTANNTGMILIIAADYGGQWDICQATRKLAQAVEAGELEGSAITPQLISQHLSFGDLPDPDLFVRTSGELRISNFMLWQLAYAELFFTDTLWPDFTPEELDKAFAHFSGRERRYGASEKASEDLSLKEVS